MSKGWSFSAPDVHACDLPEEMCRPDLPCDPVTGDEVGDYRVAEPKWEWGTYNGPCDVYFIRSAGMVKIGMTRDIRHRMRCLALASPTELHLLRRDVYQTVVQARAAEAELHAKFAACRDHGEWFRETPELRAYIGADGLQ